MQYICTDKYLKIMENTIRSLKIRCLEAGTTLAKACEHAGIPRQTVERWGRKPPKTLLILAKVEKAIEEIKEKNGDA